MSIDQLKDQLKKYHLSPNFTYGQNFLVDDLVLEDILDAADVKGGDCVLEIGPGIGNLTEKLLDRAGFVLSVEKDPKFLPILKRIKKDHRENFRFEIADILEYDFQKALVDSGQCSVGSDGMQNFNHYPLPTAHYKVVANIPYYITGKILQMLFSAESKPESITILTQKEVAQNIVAGPGKLSVLAISVQLFGEASLKQIVPAGKFYPAPKVDSAILHIRLFGQPKYGIGDENKFFRIVKACFAGKRKQIHNTLKNNLKLPQEEIDRILASLKINPAARPQELAIEQWVELAKRINYSNCS